MLPSGSPAVGASPYTHEEWANCRAVGQPCTWCPRGYSCAVVNAPLTSTNADRSHVFYFSECRVHSVRDWRFWGQVINHRTDGAQTTLYDQDMNALKTVPADNRVHFHEFEKVGYVQVC